MNKLYMVSVALMICNAQAMLEPLAECSLFTSAFGVQIPQVHKKFVELRKIAVSPDGDRVAIRPTKIAEAYFNLLELETNKIKYCTTPQGVTNMCFGTNKDFYLTDRENKIFQLSYKDDIFSLGSQKDSKENSGAVFGLSMHPSGTMLYSASTKGVIELKSLPSLRHEGVLVTGVKTPVSLAFNNDGTLLYTTNKDISGGTSFLSVWIIERVSKKLSNTYNGGKPVRKLTVNSPITAIDAYNEDCILSAHEDGNVRLWDVRDLKKAAITTNVADAPIEALHAFGDGGYAAHVLDRNQAKSSLVVVDASLRRTSFPRKDPAVAYVYDKANRKLLCAVDGDEIDELDVHAITCDAPVVKHQFIASTERKETH